MLADALIGLDREIRLFQRLVKIAQRDQRQRLVGREIERKLQIDEPQILPAATPERRAEAVERLRRTGLRAADRRRKSFALPEPLHGLDPQRMVRKLLVEGFVHGPGFLRRMIAPQPTGVGFNDAQRAVVELVGLLESLAGLLLVAGQVEDKAGMQILEDRVPIGACEPIDLGYRLLAVACAVARPGAEQRGGEIGDGTAHRSREIAARQAVALLL